MGWRFCVMETNSVQTMRPCSLFLIGLYQSLGRSVAVVSPFVLWLQIRESIKALFPNRTCFPLVRPMSDESQLQRLEAVAPSQLRPEFQQVRARSRVSTQATPQARRLACLAETALSRLCVSHLSQGGIPGLSALRRHAWDRKSSEAGNTGSTRCAGSRSM